MIPVFVVMNYFAIVFEKSARIFQYFVFHFS
jgi:hypothetical protein